MGTNRYGDVGPRGGKEYGKSNPRSEPDPMDPKIASRFNDAILFSLGPTPEDPWCRDYLRGRRAKIENEVPVIEYDWERLASCL